MSRATGVHAIDGVGEDAIVGYLADTPGFFERHAELLGCIRLAGPYGDRAVSLHERQTDVLRARIRGLEQRVAEMIRHGQENAAIADRLHRWTLALMRAPRAADLPQLLVDAMRDEFIIPQAALRLWNVASRYADEPFARGASPETRSLASGLKLPYCGANTGFEPVGWLDGAAATRSLALIPMRRPGRAGAFGLLVVGSPDATRFLDDMAVDFLVRIGEIAGAALAPLLAETD